MTKHHIIYYTSDDGMIFDNEEECYNYELQKLYEKSGVRLYENGHVIEKLDFDTHNNSYDIADEIQIDREKANENMAFANELNNCYGWSLIFDAVHGTADRYQLYYDSIKEI